MDESKLFIHDETDAQNKSEKKNETENENQLCVTEDETEKENQLWKQEPDAPNESRKSHSEFEPKLKRLYKESETYPKCSLEKDEVENPHQRTDQLSETNRGNYSTGITQQINDKGDYSLAKKNKYVRKMVQKYLKRARTNPTGSSKNYRSFRRDGKTKKTRMFKSTSPQILAKKKRCISQMDKCFEISKKKDNPQTEVQVFGDSKSEVTNIRETKPKTGKRIKLTTKPSAMHKPKYQSDELSKDETLVSSSTESARTTSHNPGMISRTSKVRLAEEVLTHFKCSVLSKKEPFVKSREENSCKQILIAISEQGNQGLKYPVKEVAASGNRDLKDVMGSGMIEKSGKRSSDSLTIRGDTPVALIKPTKRIPSQRITEDEKVSLSPKVTSAEEVLAHFRSFMQSKKESFDKSMANYSCKEDMKAISEPDNQCSNYPAKEVTSPNQDLKDVMRSGIIEESGKRSGTLAIQDGTPKALIKSTRYTPRQRIIYDEKVEYIRWWVIQQIKDKEIVLKFRIMEGKYSKDLETKLRCIEKAKCLQSEIDIYFDILDDHKKLINVPKLLKNCSMQKRKSGPNSPTKDKKKKGKPIKNFTSLFSDLYLSSLSKSKNENIYERINPRKFMDAYNEYLESKEKRDCVSQRAEQTAKCTVNDFYRTLLQCKQKMQDKIPYPQNRSVEDYQNFVKELRTAVEENLNCLKSLIPPATSVVFPLMGSLSQSRKKILEILDFLGQERPDVFPGYFK